MAGIAALVLGIVGLVVYVVADAVLDDPAPTSAEAGPPAAADTAGPADPADCRALIGLLTPVAAALTPTAPAADDAVRAAQVRALLDAREALALGEPLDSLVFRLLPAAALLTFAPESPQEYALRYADYTARLDDVADACAAVGVTDLPRAVPAA
ncbi:MULTISPECIES: hypothetical protein [unclassified Blastococcus]